MDWFCGQLARSGSPFVPPSPCHNRGMADENGAAGCSKDCDDEDDRPLINREENTAEQNNHDDDGQSDTNHFWYRPKQRRKCGGPEVHMEAGSRLAALLISIVILVSICLFFADWTIRDLSFANVPANPTSFRWIELERICVGNNSNNCCTVADVLDMEKNFARRVLFLGRVSAIRSVDFESEVPLLPPPGRSVHDSDTRLWAIDGERLLNEYVAAMALLPLVLGSWDEQQPLDGRGKGLLVIGLGGGTLDMFWHRQFPQLNITVYELNPAVAELAARWFEAVNDNTRRTIVADGLEAIHQAAKHGTKFDAIVVDACDSDRAMPCPGRRFLEAETLKNIRATLTPMGTFVLNVLPLREEQQNIRAVEHKLLAVFPTCVRTRMARQMNTIFACLPYALQAGALGDTVGLWNGKMTSLVHKMAMQKLLPNATLIADII